MGQQISSAAEGGAGAAGMPYSAAGLGMPSSQASATQHTSSGDSGTAGGDTNHHSHHHQHYNNHYSSHQAQHLNHYQPHQQKAWSSARGSTGAVAAMFDSQRAMPPLPQPATAPRSPSAPQDAGGGGGGADGYQGGATGGDSAHTVHSDSSDGTSHGASRPEMDLGKMSIREAIDSFIEKCLHTSNDGGASDSESNADETNSNSHNQSKTSAGNIFALDNVPKRPSPSSRSPHTPKSRDSRTASPTAYSKKTGEREKIAREMVTTPSPKSDPSRPHSQQHTEANETRGTLDNTDNRDSRGAANAIGESSRSRDALGGSIDESDETVLVIDCGSDDREESKSSAPSNVKSSNEPGETSLSRDVIETHDFEDNKIDSSQGNSQKSVDPQHGPKGSLNSKVEDLTLKKDSSATNSPEKRISPTATPGLQEQGSASPGQKQGGGNILMRELQKKTGSSLPHQGDVAVAAAAAASVRPVPLFSGSFRLQSLIDKVLDSSLNPQGAEEGASSGSPELSNKSNEGKAEDSKKSPTSALPPTAAQTLSSPKDAGLKVEVVTVDDNGPNDQDGSNEKTESLNKNTDNTEDSKSVDSKPKLVPLCFQHHIEKVLLETFLSYEEEERQEALKKGGSATPGASSDGKSRASESPSTNTGPKLSTSPKRDTGSDSTISVQDIVDRVITQTEAINKNISSSSAAQEVRAGSCGTGSATYGDTSRLEPGSGPGRGSSTIEPPPSSSTSSSLPPDVNSKQHYNPLASHHHSQQPPPSARSSHDRALQEAQRHAVQKEHQTSTTGRKRGRPRRVSPSVSAANSNSSSSGSTSIASHHGHPGADHKQRQHLAYMESRMAADFRLGALPPGHHVDDRPGAHHGPPPALDYSPHGSIAYGLPPGHVNSLLHPPGSSATILRQSQHQQAKELTHGLHPSSQSRPGYRSHHPGSDPAQGLHHPSRSAQAGSGSGSSSAGGIKPPPPLILADSVSPGGTRLVPVSHIPTRSCSCHSCIAHFSTPSSAPSAEKGGSPASTAVPPHSRHPQSGRSSGGGSGGWHEGGRDKPHSPASHPPHHPHLHPAYGAAPYSTSSSASSTSTSPYSSSRRPPPNDYYNHQQHQQQATSRSAESLRPVVPSVSGRGLPPQAIMPSYIASHRQQTQRAQDMAAGAPPSSSASASSSHHHHGAYSRESSAHRYGEMKTASSTSASSNPYHDYHHRQAGSQPPGHPGVDTRAYSHESVRHPDYRSSTAASASSALPHEQTRSHRDPYIQRGLAPPHSPHGPPPGVAPPHSPHAVPHHAGPLHSPLAPPSGLAASHSPHGPPPGLAPPISPHAPPPMTARHPPVAAELDSDAPLDLSVKPTKRAQQDHHTTTEGQAGGLHRSGSFSSAPPQADSPDTRLPYRRSSLEPARTPGGSSHYSSSHDYRESGSQPSSYHHHHPHYHHQHQQHGGEPNPSSDRYLPHPHSPHHSHLHPSQQRSYPHQHHHPAPQHHSRQQQRGASPVAPQHQQMRGGDARSGQHYHQQYPQPEPRDARLGSYSSGSAPSASSRSHQPQELQPRGYPHHPQQGHAVGSGGSGGGGGGSSRPHGLHPHYHTSSSASAPPLHEHHQSQHPAVSNYQALHLQHPYAHNDPQRGSRPGAAAVPPANAPPSSSPSQPAAAAAATTYHNRSPGLGRPQVASPAHHHYHHQQQQPPRSSIPSPHYPAPHPTSPSYHNQRPQSQNLEGVDNPRPGSGPSSSGARGSQDTPSPDGDDLDTQSKGLNVSKHEPIQNIIGSHSPGDILYLRCRLCAQTYGNPYGFRKHFRKEHGFEPKAEHTIVQTISATKNAMAQPGPQDQMDVKPGPGQGADYTSYTQHDDPNSRGGHPYLNKEEFSETPASSDGSARRTEGSEDTKLLECPECSQTFQLNDFGSFKRHCRQHSLGSSGVGGSGPFLCYDCQRCFAEPGQLAEHLKSHTDFTPSVCGLCGASFSAPDYLADHLKAAHGHTGSTPGTWGIKLEPGNSASEDRKQGMGKDGQLPVSATGTSINTDTSLNNLPPIKRGLPPEPHVSISGASRGLQVEKLPAEPTITTASPDSSYSDEKLRADSQPGSTTSSQAMSSSTSSTAPPSGSSPGLDKSSPGGKQLDRDLDTSSPHTKSREGDSHTPKLPSESGKSLSSSPGLTGKQPFASTETSRGGFKDDAESVSSDRESTGRLSVGGSRTSSPGAEESEFVYKHKKYSRQNRKRSTEASSSGEPLTKTARSSSEENSNSMSNSVTAATINNSPLASTLAAKVGGKSDQNLSPVVTSSASWTQADCESEDSSCSRSPNGSSKRVSTSGAGKLAADQAVWRDGLGKKALAGEDQQNNSKDKGMKTIAAAEGNRKRKAEDGSAQGEERKWGSSGGAAGESSKFNWERLTRSQMGKTSQSVSYTSSS